MTHELAVNSLFTTLTLFAALDSLFTPRTDFATLDTVLPCSLVLLPGVLSGAWQSPAGACSAAGQRGRGFHQWPAHQAEAGWQGRRNLPVQGRLLVVLLASVRSLGPAALGAYSTLHFPWRKSNQSFLLYMLLTHCLLLSLSCFWFSRYFRCTTQTGAVFGHFRLDFVLLL